MSGGKLKPVPFLRNSERSTFRRCAQKWWWSYREGLIPKYGGTPDALWFGTGWHEVLAQWYKPGLKRGTEPSAAWRKWVGAEIVDIRTSVSDDFSEDEFHDAGNLGAQMFDAYRATYDKDNDWFVVATEQAFQVEIPDPDAKHGAGLAPRPLVVLAGTFDGVMWQETLRAFTLMEHKTAKRISTGHLTLDDQAGTYWLVAGSVLREQGVLGKKEQIAGIQYNYAQKSRPDPRPRDRYGRCLNKDGSISKVQPGKHFDRPFIERGPRERQTQLIRIQHEAQLMSRVRAGRQPIIKNTAYDCQYCPFFEMCNLHEKGGSDWKRYRDAMYTTRDPYADHRKSAASE